jgi:hypothetical protein
VLARCEAQPTGELACATKGGNAPDRADERGRGQQSDARNLEEPLDGRVVLRDRTELSLDADDARFHRPRVFVHTGHCDRQLRGQLLNHGRHCGQGRVGARRERDTVFPEEAAQRIDPRRSRRHPLLADAVQRDDFLLCGRLHRHWRNVPGAHRIEERIDVRPIRLVAPQVRLHIPHREQRHAVPVALRDPPPMMCRAAGFHHHVSRGVFGEKAGRTAAD